VAHSDNRLRLVSDSDGRLRAIIATLEENRAELAESANPEAAQILAVAILQLRMRLHRVADSELKVLCHAVLLQEAERAKKADDLAAKDGRFSRRGWPNSVK
jgi:signal transduction histidine kinase